MSTPHTPLRRLNPREIPIEFLLSTAAIAVIGNTAFGASGLVATLVGVAYFVFVGVFLSCPGYTGSYLNKRRLRVLAIFFIGLFAILAVFQMSHPAEAQLLVQAQQAACNLLTGSVTGAGTAGAGTGATTGGAATSTAATKSIVNSLFGIIRAILLLGIVIGVIMMLQSRDDREKLMQIGTTAAYVIVGTVVLDLLAFLVAGSLATTAC